MIITKIVSRDSIKNQNRKINDLDFPPDPIFPRLLAGLRSRGLVRVYQEKDQ